MTLTDTNCRVNQAIENVIVENFLSNNKECMEIQWMIDKWFCGVEKNSFYSPPRSVIIRIINRSLRYMLTTVKPLYSGHLWDF